MQFHAVKGAVLATQQQVPPVTREKRLGAAKPGGETSLLVGPGSGQRSVDD